MPLQVFPESFTIEPPVDLLEKHSTLRSLSKQLAIHYASRELVTDEQLQQVGAALWAALDIDAAFEQHCSRTGTTIVSISVTSSSPELLQLPWETLHHPQHGFLALQRKFALSRQLTSAPTVDLPPEPGPLRVLLFTAMTEDQQRLDVEEEQAQIQEALLPMVADGLVTLNMPNDGRFNTFKQTLQSFQPHVLFLSGHGKYHDQSLRDDKPSYAEFLFESERLDSQGVTGSRLAQAFTGTAVQCVVLSACESGQSASDQLSSGLMHQLALAGIPHVIGMRESIFDVAATRFNRQFCDAITDKQRVDVALQHAREAISQPLNGQSVQRDTAQTGELEQSYGQWCLPILLSNNPTKALIDWQFQSQPKQQPLLHDAGQAFQQLSLPQRFIGRRRELRELENKLGRSELSKLLITGPGGQGKTALAGHLAQHLQRQGRKVLVWSANTNDSNTEQTSWRTFQFELEMMLDEAQTHEYQHRVAQYDNQQQRIEQLLKLVAEHTPHGLLLLFDNLETLQDPKTREIADPDTRAWIEAASSLSNSRLCLLLTSRWVLLDWSQDQHWPLNRLSYNDYLQLARQLKLPADFLHNRERIRQLHTTLHGNARGLTFFAAAIQNMDSQEEDAWIEKLAETKAELQIDMALQVIYDQRSPEQCELLHRLTVYQTPVAIEGVVKLALDMTQPQQLLDELLAVSLVEQAWQHDWQCMGYQLPATVSDWLVSQHSQPPTRPTQQLAASYQLYLFRYERQTLQQAIHAHDALRLAEQSHAADRLVLNVIIGPLNRRGLYQTLLDQWLPAVCESQDPQTRGEALGQYGKQCHHIGDYDTALSYLKQSLAILKDIGDKSGEGTTLNNISGIYRARGDYDTALSYLKQSLAILKDIGDTVGLCATLFNMGHIHLQNEEQQQAIGAWVTVYRLAKPMQLAQALQALEGLAEQLGLPGGMDGWEALAAKFDEEDGE